MSNIPQKPDFNKLVTDNLTNMKRRTSQIKGETMDNLTDVISDNFKQFFQIAQQLIGQMEQKDKQIGDLQKKLETYESAHPELKIAQEKAQTVKVAGKK